jgi:hypothetical protein
MTLRQQIERAASAHRCHGLRRVLGNDQGYNQAQRPMKNQKPSPMLLALAAIFLAGAMDVCSQPPAVGSMGATGDFRPTHMMGFGAPPRPPDCPGFVLASQTLTFTDHGIKEGYFEVGEGFSAMMRPGNPLLKYIEQNRGKSVKIRLYVDEERTLELLRKR